jgi:hypothetical protein
MNATFKCAITIALFSVTAAASAYEGFDPYSDPTLSTAARPSATRSGSIASAKSVSPRTVQSAPAASLSGRELQTHHVVVMRSTSVPHRGAPVIRDDAHRSEMN